MSSILPQSYKVRYQYLVGKEQELKHTSKFDKQAKGPSGNGTGNLTSTDYSIIVLVHATEDYSIAITYR